MVTLPTRVYIGEGFASVECYMKFTTGFILSLGLKSKYNLLFIVKKCI